MKKLTLAIAAIASLVQTDCAWWQKHGEAVVETGICILVDAVEMRSFGEIAADCKTTAETIATTLDRAEVAVERMSAAPDAVAAVGPDSPPATPRLDAASSCVLAHAQTETTRMAVANACNTSRRSVDATLAEARLAVAQSHRERTEYRITHRAP